MNKVYVLIGYSQEKDEDYLVTGGGSSTKPSVKAYVKRGTAINMAKRYRKQDPTVDAYEFNFEDAVRVRDEQNGSIS